MELRGPILLVFAASLVLSSITIAERGGFGPKIRLSGGSSDCSAFAKASVGGRSGCFGWGR